MRISTRLLSLLICVFLLGTSCMTTRAYQRQYVNDEQMELANKKLQFFETNMETYREGSSGANGGKVGGGCGCN